MGSTSSETLPSSSSSCRTGQETSDQKEPNQSSNSGHEAFPFSCFKPRPKLRRDINSDEVDKLIRFINDDMEYISKVSEKIKDYEDEIPELKRTFDESLKTAEETTSDDLRVVDLPYDLSYLQKKVTNLKQWMIAKESEAEAFKEMINADQDFITEVSEKTKMYMMDNKESMENMLDGLNKYGGTVAEFRDLKKKVTKEKQRITSKHKDESKVEEDEEEEEPESTRNDQFRSHVTGAANIKGGHAALEKMPNLSKSSFFAESALFKDLKSRYDDLRNEKQCLLCFSVFPENAKIKRRVMTYWWIGEGFVPPLGHSCHSGKTAEDYADDFFDELIAKDFIEPSSKSSPGLANLVGVKTCKMKPFVRSMVIILAKRVKFFDFDDDMNVTSDYSSSHRACFTAGKRLEFNTKQLNSLYTLFNVSEAILQFNPELFRWMRSVKVLYLGSWQISSANHVDIVPSKSANARDLDVLEGLGHVKDLRFLSLQRMSRIRRLPTTIWKLKNLTILDIRACQNLKEIPNYIHSLVNLTHLDMSECYLLDHMPKGLSSLTNLEVLGGFVVGESNDSPRGPQCTLTDLRCMKKLRKLSIETGLQNFPSPAHLGALNKLGELCKLTIAWGRGEAPKSSATADKGHTTSNSESKENHPCFPWLKAPKCPWDRRNASPTQTREDGMHGHLSEAKLPSKLEKLDLQCFPNNKDTNKDWLKPENLSSLKKLYIRGGKCFDLGANSGAGDEVEGTNQTDLKECWTVEVLRLKYLADLKMEWKELQRLFPKLSYLETVNCPKLSFFPCDENGVWMKK